MDAVDEKRRLTLGEFLKQSREKKNLSLQVVADELRLKISTVKALEENNYTDIGNFVYVKGYLRSYAKLLNVNIDKALQELKDPSNNTPTPEAAKKNMEAAASQAKQISTAAGIAEPKTDKISIFIIILILVLLITIAFLWYERSHRVVAPVDSREAAPTVTLETPAAPTSPQHTPEAVMPPPVQSPQTPPSTPADKLPPDPSLMASVSPSVDPTMTNASVTDDTIPSSPSKTEEKSKDPVKPFQSTIDITPSPNHLDSVHIQSDENIVNNHR